MLQGLVKQREDSVDQFRKANRPELAEKEQGEIVVLKAYLPAEGPDAEVDAAVDEGRRRRRAPPRSRTWARR